MIKRCDNKDVWYYFLKLTSLQIKSFFRRHLDKGTINLMRNRKDAFYHRPLSAREVILSLSNQASINLALCALHHFAKIPVEPFEPLGSFASVCSFTGLWESAKPNNVEEPN